MAKTCRTHQEAAIQAERDEVRAELEELREQVQQCQELREENAELRQMLGKLWLCTEVFRFEKWGHWR